MQEILIHRDKKQVDWILNCEMFPSHEKIHSLMTQTLLSDEHLSQRVK